jgi:hypothetical protein
VLALLFGLLVLGLAKSDLGSARAQLLGALAATCGVGAALSWRYDQLVCSEIRLNDAAKTCEFETARGVIALPVHHVIAIKYDKDAEAVCDYRICYAGGKILVETGMSSFPDFLARLKTLNPRLDLSSVPPWAWHD